MYRFLLLAIIAMLYISGCKNPFAPDLTFTNKSGASPISDLSTKEGIFTNLQYAYATKDTTVYGEMLNTDFIFTYRDYEQGYDVSWSRAEEMRLTNSLFLNSDKLDLTWNNIVMSSVAQDDSLQATIIRSFTLQITLNPSDIFRVDGRVNLQLAKNKATGKWQIIRWLDESNY
ncbi:MAG: hypothetical protein LWX56_09875 [Ignavibacteria bacterium]|nr:hypothetical protein [Ignavibacteria bacterium]